MADVSPNQNNVFSVVVLLFLNDLIFFFNDTATTEIYTLSLHDALPISRRPDHPAGRRGVRPLGRRTLARSEEHTSELQSRPHLVCRLLLEKKKYLILRDSTQSVGNDSERWSELD